MKRRYEPPVAAAIRHILGRGDAFVDVGAHVGLWAAYAADLVGPEGRILAIEPGPPFDRLKALEGIAPAVEAVRCGVGCERGTATFYGIGLGTTGSFEARIAEGGERRPGGGDGVPIEVPIETLDDLVESRGLRPRLVKVDVEGFEVEVLAGAPRLRAAGATDWIVEVHPHQLGMAGRAASDVHDVLVRAGYSLAVLPGRHVNPYHLVATRPALPRSQ